MFREMEEKMGFHRPYNPAANAALPDFMGGGPHWPPMSFDDSSFFQLRPSAAVTHQVSSCALKGLIKTCRRFHKVKRSKFGMDAFVCLQTLYRQSSFQLLTPDV